MRRDSLFNVTQIRREGDETWDLWRRARSAALKEKKTPILRIDGERGTGSLLVVHEADLDLLLMEASE